MSKIVYGAALALLIGSLTTCDGQGLRSGKVSQILAKVEEAIKEHTNDDEFAGDLMDTATELRNGDVADLRETLNYLLSDVANEEKEVYSPAHEETSDEEIASEQPPSPDDLTLGMTPMTDSMTSMYGMTDKMDMPPMNGMGGKSDMDGDQDFMSMNTFGGAPEMTPEEEMRYMDQLIQESQMEAQTDQNNYAEIPVTDPDE